MENLFPSSYLFIWLEFLTKHKSADTKDSQSCFSRRPGPLHSEGSGQQRSPRPGGRGGGSPGAAASVSQSEHLRGRQLRPRLVPLPPGVQAPHPLAWEALCGHSSSHTGQGEAPKERARLPSGQEATRSSQPKPRTLHPGPAPPLETCASDAGYSERFLLASPGW